MAHNRVHNFNPGPSAIPEGVLLSVQEELLDFQQSGMSVMELSHRSKEYDRVHNEAIALLTELMDIPQTHQVLFLQGGASQQFGMIPLNYLGPDEQAAYVLSGNFAEKAYEEAQQLGSAYVLATTREQQYRTIPAIDPDGILPDTAYVHLTSNNTIFGTQWASFPSLLHDVPLIADMSSDILSRPIDVSQFSLIYAGAQKNLGSSGVTVVIIDKAMLDKKENQHLPTMLNYRTHAAHNSLYNTPPAFSIYLLWQVLKWAKQQGGVKALERLNNEKANLIYEAIDEHPSIYAGHADADSRSNMNITFRLTQPELEKQFSELAKAHEFVGINGHRSVGGFRISTYNAVPLESCRRLANFMHDFAKHHA